MTKVENMEQVHLLILDVMEDLQKKGGLKADARAYPANFGRIDVLCDLLQKVPIPLGGRSAMLHRLNKLVKHEMADGIAACIRTAHRNIKMAFDQE